MTKDPICCMTVNEATALKAERDGQTFYFAANIAGSSFCHRLNLRQAALAIVAAARKHTRITNKPSRIIITIPQ